MRMCLSLFFIKRSFISDLLLSHESDRGAGMITSFSWWRRSRCFADDASHSCLGRHLRSSASTGITLRHDLLKTVQCIDARPNAKPVFDWIHTPWMCVVLHGWLVKGLKGFLACACKRVLFQTRLNNRGDCSCT